ncbi:hypothetical protein [Methanobrevibacter arboriphilus]|nr:hypothetical protein [Methanobrevibacter arboriphilus]
MVFLCMHKAITTQPYKQDNTTTHRNITRCLSVCIQQQQRHI